MKYILSIYFFISEIGFVNSNSVVWIANSCRPGNNLTKQQLLPAGNNSYLETVGSVKLFWHLDNLIKAALSQTTKLIDIECGYILQSILASRKIY